MPISVCVSSLAPGAPGRRPPAKLPGIPHPTVPEASVVLSTSGVEPSLPSPAHVGRVGRSLERCPGPAAASFAPAARTATPDNLAGAAVSSTPPVENAADVRRVTAIARVGIEPRCLCGWLVCVCIQMSFTIGAGPHDDYADVSQRRSSIVDKSPVAARQRTSSAQSSGQIKCPPCAGAHKAQTVTPRGPDVIQRLLSSALCSSSYRLALGIGHILVIVNVGQARRHCTQRARLAVVLPTTGCADLEPTPSGALPWIGGAEAMTVAQAR